MSRSRVDSLTSYYSGPTSKTEIFGWCLYSWATEPFIVSAVSTYVPLLLEQFARDNGVLPGDHSKSCSVPPIDPLPPAPGNSTLVDRSFQASASSPCVVNVFGHFLDPSSFTLYVFSLSVLLQTLTVISVTGFADKGNYKKGLLLGFGFVGALVTMDFAALLTENYYRAALHAVLANICYGVVNVCGNSFLPTLVENYISDQSKAVVSLRILGLCSGLGYLAALIVQLGTMAIVVKTGSSIASLQYAILFVGAWWFLFQFPVFFLLHSRKVSSPISLSAKASSKGVAYKKLFYFTEYLKIGWVNLFIAFRQITLLKDVCIFLVGWFVILDLVTTINSAAILFSKTQLLMKTHELAAIGVLLIIFAIAGTIIIPNILNKKLGITLKNTLLIIILWLLVIPLYGILGFFFSAFGLKHKSEMYVLACWYGLSLGGLSTILRSLFGLLIPKGKESLFFALFAVTDKGSLVLGPFVVGLITDKTHNIRYCFWFLWILLIISLPIFLMLDTERGQQEALEFDELVDGQEEESERLLS